MSAWPAMTAGRSAASVRSVWRVGVGVFVFCMWSQSSYREWKSWGRWTMGIGMKKSWDATKIDKDLWNFKQNIFSLIFTREMLALFIN